MKEEANGAFLMLSKHEGVGKEGSAAFLLLSKQQGS